MRAIEVEQPFQSAPRAKLPDRELLPRLVACCRQMPPRLREIAREQAVKVT